jgi:hypothetical protein
MAAYSQDLRDRVLWGLEQGEGATASARRLEVSVRWVYHVKDRYEHHREPLKIIWNDAYRLVP